MNAESQADPVAHAQAHAACVARHRATLEALDAGGMSSLGPAGLAAALDAAQRLEQAQRLFRYRCRLQVLRRPYAPERCGAWPLRDARHDMLRVLSADAVSAPSLSGRRYAFDAVAPFVASGMRERTRASLYLSRLQARRLTAHDLRDPGESSLIGQWGLFARVDIPAGTCLGIYGGLVLHACELGAVADRRYVLELTSGPHGHCLDGETMLCLANSLYSFDACGELAGHPAEGYNAELVRFPARLAHGYELPVPAMFTLGEVRAGEEIRWNYGLHRVG